MKIVNVTILISLFLSSASYSFSLFDSKPETFEEMATKMASKFSAPIISLQELKKIQNDKNVIILDARELEEFNVSHIKNSLMVGYDDFDLSSVEKTVGKDQKIIVYCSVGYRSGDIAERLRKAGYDAYNLYGGLFGWINSNENIYINNIETKKIHGFSKKWGKWLTNGKVVY